MYWFAQNKTGGITLQVSLDGSRFEPAQNVVLMVQPGVGSPMSATAEQDQQTGMITINLFYSSGQHNITTLTITCSQGSSKCNTISNSILPTSIPPSNYTGLSAVTVSNAEDFRVFYHDNQRSISQLQVNSTGCDMGEKIGGTGLNASSIAAVNVNLTTNNINISYIDAFTQNLYNMQFTAGTWTTRKLISTTLPVTSSTFDAWNPLSGLGAAYTVGLDQLQVYFTVLDSKIYEFTGSQASQTTNTQWSDQPTIQHIWANADYVGADITALGWKNQVRFFQVEQGKLVQRTLNNATWTESFVA